MKDAWIVYSKFIMDKKNKNGDKDLVINEAKEKYNLDIDLVCAHDFYVACDERGNKLYYKGKLLNEIPKFIVFRKYDIYLARQFELMGSVVMNSSQSMVDARNKMKTYQILAKNNIRIPKTLYIVCGVSRKYFNYNEVKEYFNSEKFVMKYSTGARGNGVFLITNEEEFNNCAKKNHELVIFQEYIESSFGKDIRCYVIGGKFIGCAIRQSSGSDFRSNLAQGGSAIKFEAPEKVKEIAIKSAEALNLDVCGVDVLFGENDYLVCEVNSLPGFKSLNGTTNIRGNDALLELINEKVNR